MSELISKTYDEIVPGDFVVSEGVDMSFGLIIYVSVVKGDRFGYYRTIYFIGVEGLESTSMGEGTDIMVLAHE